MRHKWHYDFAHFDADITIAMLITNHHIEETALHEDDQDFYIKLVNHTHTQTPPRRGKGGEERQTLKFTANRPLD